MKVKYEKIIDDKLVKNTGELPYLRIELDLHERVHNMPNLQNDSFRKVMTTHHTRMDILVDECAIHIRSLDSKGNVMSITTHELYNKQLGLTMQTCPANMRNCELPLLLHLGVR